MHTSQHKVTSLMKKQRNMAQAKEQNKSPETNPQNTEIYELPNKEFNITIIKMLNKLRKIILEQNENINKEIENLRKTNSKFCS